MILNGNRTQIGEVAELVRGVTYDKLESRMEPGHGLVPILRATNIDKELVLRDFVYVPQRVVSPQQYLRPGDIVIAASSGSLSVVGKSAPLRLPWQGSFGAFCFALRPDATVVAPLFLAYFMQTSAYRRAISELAAGVNINNLKQQHLRQMVLPYLPELQEQTLIVDALDSYLSRLDDAIANLERVRRNLGRYRSSVLQAAVEGRLVPTEAELAKAAGGTFEPASVLLKRILTERRKRWEASGKKGKYEEPVGPDATGLPELPEGWCWANVDQLANEVRNGCAIAPDATEGVPILRISSVRPLALDLSDRRYLSGTLSDYANDIARPGDVLATRYNGSRAFVGVAALMPSSASPIVHPDKLIRLRFSQATVCAAYVATALNGGRSRRFVESRIRTTAGQAGISGSDLKATPIPVPPLDEQVRIVAEVERLFSVVDEQSRGVALAITRTQRLRQSILKWAFEGKLVDQDPNDGPVSAFPTGMVSTGAAKGRRPRVQS